MKCATDIWKVHFEHGFEVKEYFVETIELADIEKHYIYASNNAPTHYIGYGKCDDGTKVYLERKK